MIFGSKGAAQADAERMEEINREIGLTNFLNQGHDDEVFEDVQKKDVEA